MNRGMKKWAPYKSLNEQYDYISKMLYEKNKCEKPKISMETAEEINEILVNYHKQDLKITYYEDGYVFDLIAPIFKIDVLNKRLYLDRTSFIDFSNLLNLENI